MFVQDIDLHVDYESMGLKPPEKEPEFTGYISKITMNTAKDGNVQR